MPTPREDSVLFKEIWRSLHRNGWTSKPPALRSLDTSYRYVNPGCNPDGDEGTDFFRGEQALVAYYQKQGDKLIQTDGEMVRVLTGNDLSILSRSILAPSVGEQERTNAGTDDVIIDKESDEGDTAVGQRISGVFDAEKGVDLYGDCASSCSADEEHDDGFPRCRTETSAPVGGSVGRDYNSGGSVVEADSIQGLEAAPVVLMLRLRRVPQGLATYLIVSKKTQSIVSVAEWGVEIDRAAVRLFRTSVMVLAMVAEVTFEAARYGAEYVESVEGVGDVEVVAVGEPFPMHAQMIQMVTD
ncbi:hypothetical protein PR002_g12473 [Phytophthora rubi]|uniref:Uncharacterized protein n=1 Tax=Phytophthora rubi TaxID=129364 RepID=A0A6A3LN06_9STRA|nr:hypothetical protein PR002_g12473 [Phytophthora rubi]